jgi:hypothetical protein
VQGGIKNKSALLARAIPPTTCHCAWGLGAPQAGFSALRYELRGFASQQQQIGSAPRPPGAPCPEFLSAERVWGCLARAFGPSGGPCHPTTRPRWHPRQGVATGAPPAHSSRLVRGTNTKHLGGRLPVLGYWGRGLGVSNLSHLSWSCFVFLVASCFFFVHFIVLLCFFLDSTAHRWCQPPARPLPPPKQTAHRPMRIWGLSAIKRRSKSAKFSIAVAFLACPRELFTKGRELRAKGSRLYGHTANMSGSRGPYFLRFLHFLGNLRNPSSPPRPPPRRGPPQNPNPSPS